MSEKVKIGFIGAGGIAETHAKYYRQSSAVEFAAVADIDIERAKRFSKAYNIPEENVFKEYEEMLDKVPLDGVSICTPHKYHSAPTVYALKKGVHVLVEKPMATSAKEALEMLRAAIQYRRILMVGFQNRFSSEIIAARRFVESGLLGGFYYGETVEGRERRRAVPPRLTFIDKELSGGGVLLDLGCYAIDNAMYILGYPEVVRVSGHIYTTLGRDEKAASVVGSWGSWDVNRFSVEDFAVGRIVLKNGAVLWLKVAWAMHNDDLGRPFFLGLKGGLKLYPLEIFRDESGYMTTSKVVLPQKDPWMDKIGRFIEAITKGLSSPIDPRESVYEMVILDALYQSSSRNGEEVRIHVPDEVQPILNNIVLG
ncbi:MAG: Gfo/Idh/MocA family oxidoreductase [Ignisphaera sp.]|nr:Gfo/Idh/MocA family oxidoreductase [Ignisphaera sp.]MCX8167559.1 Gfo/Idh/MocA family oxidoreductase [Ignisphaera sp.]MDW8086026.1 Gfo/Idh/MocA family oxidoreductase [Ignisphaera sp.]